MLDVEVKSLADIEVLEMHDFDSDPSIAVRGALIDVARYGVAQFCNIGPKLPHTVQRIMRLWAENNDTTATSLHKDGKIESEVDRMNSRIDEFSPTVEAFKTALETCTDTDTELIGEYLRYRKPTEIPDWHHDGAFDHFRYGFRLALTMGVDEGSRLVVARTEHDRGDAQQLYEELAQDSPSDHIVIPYLPRTGVILAEGRSGVKIRAKDGNIYRVDSVPHGGVRQAWSDTVETIAAFDFASRGNPFDIPIEPSEIRRAA